jgi:hypothetical protein
MDLAVNGSRRSVQSDRGRPLLRVLCEELGLTGAKYGCGERQWGATVNPDQLKHQVLGGTFMGLGGALFASIVTCRKSTLC